MVVCAAAGISGDAAVLTTWDRRSTFSPSFFPNVRPVLPLPLFLYSNMIGRAAIRPSLNAVARSSPSGANGQRNMATLREIEMRLKSVRNIEKITKVGQRVALLLMICFLTEPFILLGCSLLSYCLVSNFTRS